MPGSQASSTGRCRRGVRGGRCLAGARDAADRGADELRLRAALRAAGRPSRARGAGGGDAAAGAGQARSTWSARARSACPRAQTLATDLVVGDGAVLPDTRRSFDAWRRAIPKPLGSAATFRCEGGGLRIAVPYPGDRDARRAVFLPPRHRRGRLRRAADGGARRRSAGGRDEGGRRRRARSRACCGSARSGAGDPRAAGRGPPARAAARGGRWPALLAFAGAVLGGLILNIMPCVFPILSLKALSLARVGRRTSARRGTRRWPIPAAWCWCAWRWAGRSWRCARAGRRWAGRSSCRIRG